MPPSPGSEEGDTINNYHVRELLGRGAFAVTRRCINRTTGVEGALKIIDKTKIQDEAKMERVRKEVEIHSRLKHESVVKMYNYFEDSSSVYLVLELCEDGDLHQYLKRNGNRMIEKQARKVMSQIVYGLLYLHSHGIVHRDLSPKNLLLKNNMDIKIADFGLATEISTPMDKHYTMCGTPNYISPEIATQGSHGHKTDLWSVGCLLYTCLVGEPPFDSEGVKPTLDKVALGEYQLPSHLSKHAKDLIRRLLRINPLERIDLHSILDHPFMHEAEVEKYSTNYFDGNISSCSSTTSCSSCTQSPYSFSSYSSARNTTSDEDSKTTAPCSVFECMNKRSPISDKCSGHLHTSQSVRSHNTVLQNNSILSHKKTMSVNGQTQLTDFQQCTISEQSSRNILAERNTYSSTTPQISEGGKENANPSSRVNATKQESRNVDEMEPLSASRLRPFRQKNSNTVTNILGDESISLEFFRTRDDVEYVIEVMRVSRDGMKVTIFTPQEKTILRDTPLPVPLSAVSYAFSALPQKYWKKYQYAAKFVRLVKTKTPKVTLYSSKAKCSLMESDKEDFEAMFYDGSKVSMECRSNVRECNIMDIKGNVTKLGTNAGETDLNSLQRELLDHARTCHQQCQLLERSVASLQNTFSSLQTSEFSYFPLVVGRRPHNPKRTNKKYGEVPIISKANHLPESPVHAIPRSLSLLSYVHDESSVFTLTQSSQQQHRSQPQEQPTKAMRNQTALPTRPQCGPARASSTSSLDRVGLKSDSNPELDVVTLSAHIPGVGWAHQLKSGEIQIQFNEGTQLKLLNPHSKWLRIVFIDDAGRTNEYNNRDITDMLPPKVKDKLSLVPDIIGRLKQKQMSKK